MSFQSFAKRRRGGQSDVKMRGSAGENLMKFIPKVGAELLST
jgi:hypothetical protein